MRQLLDAAGGVTHTISAIVPTIGRAESLATLLDALAAQTRRPDEVIVADGSDGDAIRTLTADGRWADRHLQVRYLRTTPPNAVRQRQAAIAQSSGSLLLLLDDDVVPEPRCVEAMLDCLVTNNAVAVSADFSNQDWPPPTTLWRWYLRVMHGVTGSEWQGRVIGPLLRFGYHPVPSHAVAMEWIGSGNTLVRRDAYDRSGGFSNFFLHRSTVNEDVDLGVKLLRIGPLYLCGAAQMAHLHAPGGRPAVGVIAEDDLFNRFQILRHTIGRSRSSALAAVFTYFLIETASSVAATARAKGGAGAAARLSGRTRALLRILRTAA